ncbi:MCE family protein [[Mycobacterium] wendilense]|uniref:MCE family protein n=1 Tax=[Mycobacterium] wendilense TaxID=3064284 RepID=A0ABM9MIL9_9MYCO|nr:MCE family protein [Mycolicibacterium sp. MU0050]CAJ1586081.1 MCE family protein [Mycolicibacterium sp. MU0050]
MMRTGVFKVGLGLFMTVVLAAGVLFVGMAPNRNRTWVTGYFANSNGIFVGDDVRVLGMPVGTIDRIEPQPGGAKITFWVDGRYPVPADVNAMIISPSLVAVRAIELTPVYGGGPKLATGSVIPEQRTAVPIEYDELRAQLQKLTATLQPTSPGGVSTLGEFVNTAADNMRGQGASVRDALTKLGQAFSALGDHSSDIFDTVKSLSIFVSALQSSHDVIRQLNVNLAAVTGLLSDEPNEVADAIANLNAVIGDVRSFVTDNKEALGITTERLASITTALNDSLDDIKQTLHVAPTAFQNFLNIYQPAQATLSGALAVTNFANPVSFLCGAIQAASQLGAEQSAKLCAQYLAPIVRNRQYNFLPFGVNPVVGAAARPNEIGYSEDWLRPDYVPPAGPISDEGSRPSSTGEPISTAGAPSDGAAIPPLAAEVQQVDPAEGLRGLMTVDQGQP